MQECRRPPLLHPEISLRPPCRYNPPLIFWGAWNTLSPLLPPVTRQKIHVVDPTKREVGIPDSGAALLLPALWPDGVSSTQCTYMHPASMLVCMLLVHALHYPKHANYFSQVLVDSADAWRCAARGKLPSYQPLQYCTLPANFLIMNFAHRDAKLLFLNCPQVLVDNVDGGVLPEEYGGSAKLVPPLSRANSRANLQALAA